VQIESGNGEHYQLYHLGNDPGERQNLASSEDEVLQMMISAYRRALGNQ
jgi:hypothetical protein